MTTVDPEILRREAWQAEQAKNVAYRERDALVCALSKLFPSSLQRHPESDITWENDWRWIVMIWLPTGQGTWHIHDSELSMFDHLGRNVGAPWDGHSTEEKYERLAALTPMSASMPSDSTRHLAEMREALQEFSNTDLSTMGGRVDHGVVVIDSMVLARLLTLRDRARSVLGRAASAGGGT